ncbi:MAG: ribonuclease HIII [Ktedonobacteraceae bacterium]
MTVKKNYEALAATLRAFRVFAAEKGWRIISDREIDYGHQITVFDGEARNNLDFFPSGKILVGGRKGTLYDELLTWREDHLPTAATYTTEALPFENSQGQPEDVQAQILSRSTAPATRGIARIGMDEAGKGDYFGPLSIAAVYVDAQTEARLVELGVRDSKLLSDMRMLVLAQEIKAMCPHSVVTIEPKRYNEAYEKIQNLNNLLAWGHARALENVLEKVPCNLAIADQFGNETVLQKALLQKGRQIKLEQRPHAEADIAVAAASILARANFVQKIEQLSIKIGKTLPKGATDPTIITIGREIVAKGGQELLGEVAKLHFRTTAKILQKS